MHIRKNDTRARPYNFIVLYCVKFDGCVKPKHVADLYIHKVVFDCDSVYPFSLYT